MSRRRFCRYSKNVFLLITILYLCSCCDAITLQKNENIYCIIPKNNLNAVVYLDPPVIKSRKELNSLNDIFTWTNNDWIKNTENNIVEGPITDKRWEDFETLRSNSLHFEKKSASFSIYSDLSEITFHFADGDQESRRYVYDKQDTSQWVHYNLISRNNKIFILKADIILHVIDDFVPQQIHVVSEDDAFWKIQYSEFRWANRITQGPPSFIKIPPTGKSCLVLYASLEKNCFLEIILKSTNTNNKTRRIITRTDNKHLILNKSWNSHTVPIEPNDDTELLIYRKSSQNNINGRWAMDLRLCNDNMGIYNFTLPKEDLTQHTCQNLNKNKKSNKYDTDKAFSCSRGYIGNFCNVSCATVLGQEYSYCEKHKICQDPSNCMCAWGYKGQFCQEKCGNRTWGLSCRETCDPNCENCHFSTGECYPAWKLESAFLVDFLCIVIAFALGIAAIFGFWCRKRMKPSNTNSVISNKINRSSVRLIRSTCSIPTSSVPELGLLHGTDFANKKPAENSENLFIA